MASAAQRMRKMRALREVRLQVPDLRLASVRRRIARQSAKLNPDDERATMAWIEAVGEFDQGFGEQCGQTRRG